MDYCLVLTTTPNMEEAKKIAHHLVENKLAACVNIIPQIVSIYKWNDKINEEQEYQLFIKTRKSIFEKVKDTILTLHSYELPEVIMVSVKKGHKDYLDWIRQETIKSDINAK